MRTLFTAMGFTVIFAALAGCNVGGIGGGGGGTPKLINNSAAAPTIASGVFVDSPVSGLKYVSGTETGFTSNQGTFLYEVGKPVTFYVGPIKIGTIPVGEMFVTPIDLVSGSGVSASTPQVVNIATFLQSIDNDGNPSNGIRITQAETNLIAKGTTINFAQSESAFAADGVVQSAVSTITSNSASGARGLMAAGTVQKNLTSAIDAHFAGSYSGTWTGTTSAPDGGNWTMTISPTGVITGSGTALAQYGSYKITLSGSLGTNGAVSLTSAGVSGTGTASTGATFSGMIDGGSFTLTGSWSNQVLGTTGTFSGRKL